MSKINIIIPSIGIDDRLLRCLDGISKQSFKQFFVTIILDETKNKILLKKYKFKINLIQSPKETMAKKRNLAAKKFNSNILAFIDSDASPGKNWLKNAYNELNKNNIHITGGPNLPFNYKNFWKKITHFCKRSYFVTAKYNFINYKSVNKFTDLLHSSNFLILRKVYQSVKGMDEKIYIGEDHDLFFRLNKKFKDLKISFKKNIFVYHEDRELKYFLFQRFCYGLNIFTSKNTIKKRFFAVIPFGVLIFLTILLVKNTSFFLNTIFIFFLLSAPIIFWDINKYVKNNFEKIIVLMAIYLSNIFYGLGTIVYFFGFRKLLERKIYRSIKTKKLAK